METMPGISHSRSARWTRESSVWVLRKGAMQVISVRLFTWASCTRRSRYSESRNGANALMAEKSIFSSVCCRLFSTSVSMSLGGRSGAMSQISSTVMGSASDAWPAGPGLPEAGGFDALFRLSLYMVFEITGVALATA